ncbi:replicative DNA helicase [Luteimonas sp. RIT-PG2_3]
MQTPVYAEEAVLGGLMANNDAFHDVAPLVGMDHFTNPFRKRLWSAIRNRILAGEPADPVTVMELLPDDADAVLELAKSTTSARSVVTYAHIVRKNWRKREASGIAQRLISDVADDDEEGVDRAVSALMELNAEVAEHEFTGRQSMQMAFEQASIAFQNGGKLPGITTGLIELDAILGGFHDSDLTLIGGRPAMGKTAFLLGLVEACAGAGYPCGLISAEQPAIQIGIRRVALSSGVGAAVIRSGQFQDEDWGLLTAGMSKVKDSPIWIYDRSAVTLDELIGIARKWKHTHGIKALFVDYAQRITVRGSDRITEVSLVARGLKNLARDLNIPVVTLAQVKAAVDTRPDKRPTSGDLANSDELTREADQILMLYRDEVYSQDSPDRGLAEVLIEKNRHGPTGFKKFAFIPETMAFRDLNKDKRWESAA